MITWEKKSYGFYLKFSGSLSAEEAVEVTQLARKSILELDSEFTVLVDFREVQILHPILRTIIFSFAKFCGLNGMKRSAVVYSNELTVIQVKMMSRRVNIIDNERYIDSSKVSNWEEQALNWLNKGIEPEVQETNSETSASTLEQ